MSVSSGDFRLGAAPREKCPQRPCQNRSSGDGAERQSANPFVSLRLGWVLSPSFETTPGPDRAAGRVRGRNLHRPVVQAARNGSAGVRGARGAGWSGLLPRVILAAVLLGGAGSSQAADQTYHAPVLEPLPVSSSFGEFRANHFHGGIDFSTSGRIGVPVHAVSNGWVWRARASGSGYGLALYIRLDDGRTQVVAHLDRVAPGIDSFIKAAQDSLDRYEVDLSPPPGRLPVRRGDVIAWTGQSGAGPAHLHFEMREGAEANIGVNPRLLGFGDTDTAAPIIRRVLITPVGAGSRVEGRMTGKSFVATLVAGSRYRLAGPIDVVGTVRLGLDVFDPAPRDNRMAPYRLQILEGTTSRYDVRLDRFDWTRTHEVECFFDLDEADQGRHFVLNGFRPAGVRDAVYGSMPIGAGLLDPPRPPGPGTRRVSMIATDLAGHDAIVDVDLVHHAVEPSLRSAPSSGKPLVSVDLGARVTTAGLLVELPVAADRPNPSVTLAPDDVEPFSWFDRLLGRAEPAAPVSTPLHVASANRASALLPAPERFQFRPRAILEAAGPDGSRHPVGADTLDIVGLVREGKRTVRFEALSLSFPDSALFAPAWVGLSVSRGDTANGLVPASPVYRLEAPGIVLDRAARCAIQPVDAVRADVGLYRRSGAKWSWVGNESGPDGIGGDTRYLGELMLARDVRPPVVTVLAPALRATGSRPLIRVRILEFGSGITASTISATIDEVTQILAWDPESRTLEGRSRRPLPRGAHRLIVTAIDRAGNNTTITREFQVTE